MKRCHIADSEVKKFLPFLSHWLCGLNNSWFVLPSFFWSKHLIFCSRGLLLQEKSYIENLKNVLLWIFSFSELYDLQDNDFVLIHIDRASDWLLKCLYITQTKLDLCLSKCLFVSPYNFTVLFPHIKKCLEFHLSLSITNPSIVSFH